jgi:uncharacterized protein with HEPN domain
LSDQGGNRDWTLFLNDMQRFCSRVLRYADGLTAEQFEVNDMANDAVLRNLELLGEAAKQIPDEVRSRHPQVPWRRVAGLRDVLAHAYFGLEDETIWQVVSSSVPALAAQLDAVALAEGLPGSLRGTSQPSADADHHSGGASDA